MVSHAHEPASDLAAPPSRAPRGPRFRLATQLIAAIVAATLLAGGAVGAVTVNQARAVLRDDVQRRSQAAAELAADYTANYVADAQNAALLLAARADLRRAVA